MNLILTAASQYPNDPNQTTALLALIAAVLIIGVAAAAIQAVYYAHRGTVEAPRRSVDRRTGTVTEADTYGRHHGTDTDTWTMVRRRLEV